MTFVLACIDEHLVGCLDASINAHKKWRTCACVCACVLIEFWVCTMMCGSYHFLLVFAQFIFVELFIC